MFTRYWQCDLCNLPAFAEAFTENSWFRVCIFHFILLKLRSNSFGFYLADWLFDVPLLGRLVSKLSEITER